MAINKIFQEVQTSQAAAKVASGLGELGELDQNIVNNNNVREEGLLYGLSYLGYTIPSIAQTMIEMNGWGTTGGDGIKTAQKLAEELRVPLSFDANQIYAVIDAFVSVENKELLINICEDAVKTSKIKYGHKLLDAAVKQLVMEDKNASVVNPYDVNPNLMPLPTRLPKVLKDIVACYPNEFHHVVHAVALACLSFHAEGVTAIYNGTEEYRLIWDVLVFGEAAGGKSLLDRIKDLMMKEIIERDVQYYAEEETMKNSAASGKKKRGRKKKGEDAETETDAMAEKEDKKPRPIQYVGSTTSITELLYRTLNSQGHNLFMYNCEGAEFFLSCKRGPNTDIWAFKRKAVEGSEYVQSHHSVDTVSGICHPYMTSVICVQPEVAIPEYEKHISDGSASRVYATSLEVTPGGKRPVIKSFSDKLIAEVQETIAYLKTLNEKVELKRVHKAIDQWLDDKALEYEKTNNLAIDHFRRRAAQMGYKAGVFFYLLNGRKDNKQAADYAIYVAEYVLRQQLHYFGEQYNKQKSSGVKQNGVNNVNYYEMLGEVFTSSEFAALRAKHGESTNVRTIICRWRKHNPPLVEDVEPGVYRKIL